jgi:hypothetical protein
VAVKHGGAGAVRAMREGRPFTGLAAQAEQEVVTDLETEGRGAMVKEMAVRIHTCARLYYGALQTAVDQGDLAKLDTYAKRFGWLAGAALRAWAQLKQETPDDTGVLDYEKIIRARSDDT